MSNRSDRTTKGQLNKRREKEADIGAVVYKKPLGRGRHVVHDLFDNKDYVVGSLRGRITWKPGSIVPLATFTGHRHKGQMLMGDPPPGKRGASVFPVRQLVGYFIRKPTVREADPPELPPGSIDAPVILLGFNFIENPVDVFDAVVFDEETGEYIADPYVTITSATYVSATEVLVTMTVAIETPIGYLISIRSERA